MRVLEYLSVLVQINFKTYRFIMRIYYMSNYNESKDHIAHLSNIGHKSNRIATTFGIKAMLFILL